MGSFLTRHENRRLLTWAVSRDQFRKSRCAYHTFSIALAKRLPSNRPPAALFCLQCRYRSPAAQYLALITRHAGQIWQSSSLSATRSTKFYRCVRDQGEPSDRLVRVGMPIICQQNVERLSNDESFCMFRFSIIRERSMKLAAYPIQPMRYGY